MNQYLKETAMLNYMHPQIQILIKERGWSQLDQFHQIESIYNFVRDEISFGYNKNDYLSASEVLADGLGQCNTKGTLFMALLRAVGIPCRVHGFTIDKKLQKGAMTGIVFQFAPRLVVHSWVEVLYESHWYALEGYIIDQTYLSKLKKLHAEHQGEFLGYGVAVKDFQNIEVDWHACNTYIQSEGIVDDFGVYDSPDDFLALHPQNMGKFKELIYVHYGRHTMNRNVKKIRDA